MLATADELNDGFREPPRPLPLTALPSDVLAGLVDATLTGAAGAGLVCGFGRRRLAGLALRA